MSDLPKYYRQPSDPEAGVYELISLTGHDLDGDPKKRIVLHVCKSLSGFLTEAFTHADLAAGRWAIDFDFVPNKAL